jgi:hypothetical protein
MDAAVGGVQGETIETIAAAVESGPEQDGAYAAAEETEPGADAEVPATWEPQTDSVGTGEIVREHEDEAAAMVATAHATARTESESPPPQVGRREIFSRWGRAVAGWVSSLREVPSMGERKVEFTWNTLLFAGLMGVIAIFGAYAAGYQRGKAMVQADEASEPAGAEGEEANAVPAGMRTLYRVQVAYFAPSDRATAEGLAQRLRQEGYPDVDVETFPLRGRTMVRVVVGWFASRDDEAARGWLERVRARYPTADLVRALP